MKQANLTAIISDTDDGGDIIDVTYLVVKVVLDEHRETATDLLTPAIRAAIQRERRKAARRREDDAFNEEDEPDDEPGDDGEPEPGPDRLAAFRSLAGEMFWIPDGTKDGYYVSWGDATEEQHLARADNQRERARSEVEDADRHEEAADIIHEAGVACLAEVDGF